MYHNPELRHHGVWAAHHIIVPSWFSITKLLSDSSVVNYVIPILTEYYNNYNNAESFHHNIPFCHISVVLCHWKTAYIRIVYDTAPVLHCEEWQLCYHTTSLWQHTVSLCSHTFELWYHNAPSTFLIVYTIVTIFHWAIMVANCEPFQCSTESWQLSIVTSHHSTLQTQS